MITKIKRCTRCKKEFIPNTLEKVFCSTKCRLLKKKYRKQYYKLHKKQIQKYHKKNRNKILIDQKIYRQTHKKKIKKLNKIWIKNNRKKRALYKRKHRQKNLLKIRKYENNYKMLKRKKDINFKLSGNIRVRINKALKFNHKSAHTEKLIGCTIEQLKQHLEGKFAVGMSWSNWGTGQNGKGMTEWHIDHIRPCASFDLSIPEEQFKCFNYKNLQPLWAKNNHIKGDSTC